MAEHCLAYAPKLADATAAMRDKALDADWLRADLREGGAVAIIPPKSSRRRQIACDFHACRWRCLVETFLCSLKAFRQIATRCDDG